MLKPALASFILCAAMFAGALAPARSEAGSNIAWEDCYDGLDCGTLRVPLDHRRPTEGNIEIALIRVPARVPEARIGSLLVNFGGPGGPGVEGVLFSVDYFPGEIQDRFDIIGFDPRGVGLSANVDCVDTFREFPELDSTPGSRAYEAQVSFWRDFARDCQRRSSALLQHVDTNSAARDMDLIREELGDAQLTYIGFSYGSLLGQAYADLFPDNVRALVLDGVLNPAHDTSSMISRAAAGGDIALEGFFAACRASTSCAFRAPDLAAAFDEVVAAAEEDPLDGWSLPITADVVLQVTYQAMYDSGRWVELAEALRQAYEERSGVGFGVLVTGLDAPPDDIPDQTNGFEAFSAIACVDFLAIDGEVEFQRIADEAAAASPRFGRHLAYSLALPCAFWPGAPRRPAAAIGAEGAAPLLVVSSKFDPITPYVSGVEVAGQLAAAALLTHEGYGHTSHGSCISAHVVAYVVDLALPPEGAACPNADDPFPALLPEPAPPEPTVDPGLPPANPPAGTIRPPNTGREGAATAGLPYIFAGLALIVAGGAIAGLAGRASRGAGARGRRL